jgi:hypothetical protein
MGRNQHLLEDFRQEQQVRSRKEVPWKGQCQQTI